MKIQQKKVTRQVTFSSLNKGATFRGVGTDPSILWMKTEPIETENRSYNAVDLSGGEMTFFGSLDNAIPVKAIAVVEEED